MIACDGVEAQPLLASTNGALTAGTVYLLTEYPLGDDISIVMITGRNGTVGVFNKAALLENIFIRKLAYELDHNSKNVFFQFQIQIPHLIAI